MHAPSMTLKSVGYLFSLIILFSCNSSSHEKNDQRFGDLTEDQKRLPENALASMHPADGLEVELFASEPMVTNPTNISVDSKGRVWVCEAYNYDVSPESTDPKGDRIIVLEDQNHDGKADKRTVFYQGTDITTPLGIMVIENKVYVTRSPNLYIFTDTNGDLVADEKDSLFTNMGRKGDHSAHSMFPGPDGKLYFSMGNYAGEIQDKYGKPIVDKGGVAVNQKGQPYLGGMVLRCDPNGKNFEVLGHNFRNNYEPCIDSYGNIFQSDNDDDGNASCRVNFVMYYGNYGYLDELTKASWSTNRVGLEETIPERHWHQNDPGVVPNMLITGAGSPSGMTFYEGNLLSSFNNMPIHAEPYYNVVRAYDATKNGAGYSAKIRDILKSDDQWFRPVDVATAPDGSLMVADWYDPILGGGAAGDASRGRIYRVAPKADQYVIDQIDFNSIEGSIAALKSPNIETRYHGYLQLVSEGSKSIPALEDLWKSDNQAFRARAFWILALLKNTNDDFLREALRDKNPDIRIAAIRAVAQLRENVISLLGDVPEDKEPSVLREAALALRYAKEDAASMWLRLAKKYDGNDRWYLEALGIGSDRQADAFFDAWTKDVEPDLKNKSHQDIIWRFRSQYAMHLLAKLIREAPDAKSAERYFRAFDFHSGKNKMEILSTLVGLDHPDRKAISALALRQMDGSQVKMTPALRKALDEALTGTKGTIAFVNLIEKFNLRDKKNELLALAKSAGGAEPGAVAADLLIRFGETALFGHELQKLNDTSSVALMQSVKGKGNGDVIQTISNVVTDSTKSLYVRQSAVQILGSSWPGETELLELVKEPSFSKSLKPVAASILFNVYRTSIQREAEKYLPRPTAAGGSIPSIKELMASSGNEVNGKLVFSKYCITCHKVNDEGVKFGPELTNVGSKLPKDGLFRAVIFPDDGVSYGYESHLITTKDGTQSLGIITSETTEDIELTQPGGTTLRIAKRQIVKKETSGKSIMPALAPAMTTQQLTDLVSYLSSLK
jgi:putative membrane-bound dehydrogenase-like protein